MPLSPSDATSFSYCCSFRIYYVHGCWILNSFFFFLNDPPTPDISTLPLHDALPIFRPAGPVDEHRARLAARHDRLDAHIGGHPAETGVKGLPEPPPGGLAPDLAQVGGGIASFRHVEIGRAHV